MEIVNDVSNDCSSIFNSTSDSLMFFCQPKQEQEEEEEEEDVRRQKQQYSINPSIQFDRIMMIENKKQVKKTVSFPFGKCRICYDIATGVHYGVITCEGCKGFFKRSITQGLPYRCFFGDKCIINMETRNRCKACRFKRCLAQGMCMESVKMGRIPKKVKEKALRDYQKYQQKQIEDTHDVELFYDDETNEFDEDNCSLSSIKRESISSSSSSSSSSMNIRQSIDSNQEIIIIPQKILKPSEQSFRTVDLIESIISSSNTHINNLNNNLSALRLPTIFYETFSIPSTCSNSLLENEIEENIDNKMTVSKYISKINETTLIDYMFGYEIRYSKNVLQIMKYLASKLRQPFLIYELDFEVTSFFRFIRWKMLNSYLKHTKRLRILIERMFGIINLGITNYPGVNASAEQVWEDIQASIPKDITDLFEFAKDTPGLNELNRIDFTRILNHRVFEFWIIIHYPLFYKNESYVMTINGLHYTRFFMNKFIGKMTTDALHEFSARLHSLNITQVEHSLIIPIVLCLPDENLIDSENVHIIKYCYMYALYIQLCTTRTEDEAKNVFDNILQIVNSIGTLNELCKKNIGELIINKKTTHE